MRSTRRNRAGDIVCCGRTTDLQHDLNSGLSQLVELMSWSGQSRKGRTKNRRMLARPSGAARSSYTSHAYTALNRLHDWTSDSW